ncbi:MAG: rhomboid family intramembrane serine protease, partial [Flavobacteriales bacterium]
KLLYINIGDFLLINLTDLVCFLFKINGNIYQCGQPISALTYWIAVPSNVWQLIYRPWSLFTYMFVHEGLMHILFNMIVFYFSAQLFLRYMSGRQLLNTYILGGLSGGVLFILSYNLFPIFWSSTNCALCLGASASVLAVLIAIATSAPDYTVNFFLLGSVKLKYIALVLVLLDLLNIKAGNPGGHIAHLGGAIYGFAYARQLKNGRDISSGFSRLLSAIGAVFNPRPSHMRTVHRRRSMTDEEYNQRKAQRQKRLDEILDKISKSGYESLTKEEKDFLFRVSNEK